MSKIKIFNANEFGEDYIVADIHGHFNLLEKKLEQVEFDGATDRLFSLGDLIDRGAECHRVLEFLQQPWFNAILGNHEMMLLEAFESKDSQIYARWYHWGGDWAQELSEQQLHEYYEVLRILPIGIELQTKISKSIGLIHAELPNVSSWRNVRNTLEKLAQDCSVKQAYQCGTAGMLWDKFQPYMSTQQRQMIEAVKDIDHVFHGHTIIPYQPLTITNRTFMDLGSYETGELGFINVHDFLRSH